MSALLGAGSIFCRCRAPFPGVDRLASGANFEIYAGKRLSPAVAGGGDDVARIDPVTGLFEQRLVMPIQAHIAVSVVNDGDKAEALQSVSKGYATATDRPHRAAVFGTDENAVPFQPALVTRLAKSSQKRALGRPWQLAFLLLERA